MQNLAMQRNKRRDTAPERRVRRRLWALGLRYRVDMPVRVDSGRPIRPDIVFPGPRLAVFLDGCFWHGCPDHYRAPSRNVEYWRPKIEATRRRDHADTERLLACGWKVLRYWEHEDVERVVASISASIRESDDR